MELQIRGLTHRYRGGVRAALSDVALEIARGQRVGLLGPNGAGKSTLMRLVCGYLPVQGGPETRLLVGGIDVRTHARKARGRVGYLPETTPLYPELRVSEHLRFRAQIKGIHGKKRRTEVERVAGLTGLAETLRAPISTLSRGYRQRVGIADALLGEPPLVVLDEPTVGLDPNQVLEIRRLLKEVAAVQTLVFSSHILGEVETLCDRVVILTEGRVVLDASLDEALRGTTVRAVFAAGRPEAEALVAEALAVVDQEPLTSALDSDEIESRVVIDCPSADVATAVQTAIGRSAASRAVVLASLELDRGRLERVFVGAVGGSDT